MAAPSTGRGARFPLAVLRINYFTGSGGGGLL